MTWGEGRTVCYIHQLCQDVEQPDEQSSKQFVRIWQRKSKADFTFHLIFQWWNFLVYHFLLAKILSIMEITQQSWAKNQTLSAVSRNMWYSSLERVWLGATTMESPNTKWKKKNLLTPQVGPGLRFPYTNYYCIALRAVTIKRSQLVGTRGVNHLLE